MLCEAWAAPTAAGQAIVALLQERKGRVPDGSQTEELRSRQKSYIKQQNKIVYRQGAFWSNTDFIERY